MFLNGGLLINAGQATWSANVLYMGSGGVLSNAPSATFNVAFDASGQYNATALAPHCQPGLFRKTAGHGHAALVFGSTTPAACSPNRGC